MYRVKNIECLLGRSSLVVQQLSSRVSSRTSKIPGCHLKWKDALFSQMKVIFRIEEIMIFAQPPGKSIDEDSNA